MLLEEKPLSEDTMIKSYTGKFFIYSALVAVVVWATLRFFLKSILPLYILEDIFFWIILYILIIIKKILRVEAKNFLYVSLFFLSIGALAAIVSGSPFSENILRFGFVIFIFGSFLTIFEMLGQS